MHLGQCLASTKNAINVNCHYPQLTDKKTWGTERDLLKVPGSVSGRAEASPDRQSNSRAGALKHWSILLPQQKGTHNEPICGLMNDSLFCPRLSARGPWSPVVVWKHIRRFFGAPLIKKWSLSPPLESEWAFVTVLTCETRLEKSMQIPAGSLTWRTDLWSPEPPWKKFGHPEVARLERPCGKTM